MNRTRPYSLEVQQNLGTFGSAYTLAVAKSTSGIPNYHDLAYTYDYAPSDRRHVLSVNGVYEIPSATWAPRVVRAES